MSGEFALIARLRKRWGDLAVGIGDDGAMLVAPRGEQLIASTDAAVENVHFKRGWLTPRQIAFRAVTAALSDLAAMAAHPIGVLVSLQLSKRDVAGINSIADGVADAVRSAHTVILGGNLSRSDTLGITTTVLGHAFAPLKRSGARAGDLVYVTGQLGGPAAAVAALSKRKAPARDAMRRFAEPAARLAEARWLAVRGATAAIDISDGLMADAEHLAAASNVGIELDATLVPRLPDVTADQALTGGEEYELFITTRTPIDEAGFAAQFELPVTCIGRVVEGPSRVQAKGGRRIAGRKGHDHFSR